MLKDTPSLFLSNFEVANIYELLGALRLELKDDTVSESIPIYVQGLEDLRKAVLLDPMDSFHQKELAVALAKKSQFREAKQRYRNARFLDDKDDKEIMDALAALERDHPNEETEGSVMTSSRDDQNSCCMRAKT